MPGVKAFSNYLGKDKEQWKQYDSCKLIGKAKDYRPILIDQGEEDNFLEEQLLTEKIIKAAEKAEYAMQVRFQPGYDHSYFFIASFVRDHIEFHAEFLKE